MKTSGFEAKIKGLTALLFMLFLSGCATTTANLQYKADSPKQPSKQVSIRVKEFDDVRPQSERGVIGKVKNEYGMEAGDVNGPPTLVQDLKVALETELINAGYTLTQDEKDLVIKPTLERVTCGYQGKGIAQMRILIQMSDHGTEVLKNIYEGEGQFLALFGPGTNEAITIAAKKTIAAFIKDLDRYIKT